MEIEIEEMQGRGSVESTCGPELDVESSDAKSLDLLSNILH